MHYYVALDADITENDMLTANLIHDRGKKTSGGREGFGKETGWREDHDGQYKRERLMTELKDEDVASFRNFVRMDPPNVPRAVYQVGSQN